MATQPSLRVLSRKLSKWEPYKSCKISYKPWWPVYPNHANSLFWVIVKELPFCHSKYFYLHLRLSNLDDLSFKHINFSNKQKTTILFPSPLMFLQWPIQTFLGLIRQSSSSTNKRNSIETQKSLSMIMWKFSPFI